MKLIIYSDGASRGNPGPASYGFLIKNENGVILHQSGQKIGITTNNVAEYSGVLAALEYVLQFWYGKADEINVYLDSLLVTQQLNGLFRIKDAKLVGLASKVEALTGNFKLVTFTHVPRKENFLADKLANLALDRP